MTRHSTTIATLSSTLLVLGVVACGPTPVTPPGKVDCDAPGAVCAVAGTGAFGFNGDGLPALETHLYFPTAVHFDLDGAPLIVDYNNLRVRRIAKDGTIETVAGGGFHAFATDGSPAVESPLENPIEVAVTTDGGFYIVEQHAARILHVDPTGWLTVVAGTGEVQYGGDGGPAREASMSEALGIALSDDDHLFVADTDNHCIRVIDLASGIIDTVAGDGTAGGNDGSFDVARFAEPQHMTWHDGALLVADRGNHRVRRIDVETGIVETIAGTGTAGYAGDGGPAVDAQLDQPFAVAAAPDGTLYVADGENHAIRRIAPDGTIDTVVGVGEAGDGEDSPFGAEVALSLPNHVAVGPDGRVWISDTLSSKVRVYTP